jgi:hypothetical protein
MGLFMIVRGRKISGRKILIGTVFLSPLLLLILFFSSLIVMPVLTFNAWCMLTCNGWEIPKESSIFTFVQTQDSGGNGDYWTYGEDDKYYYGVNVDEIACESESAPEYFILEKGRESQDFDKLDYHTWKNKEGVGWIPKELRSYECRKETLKTSLE